MFAPETLSTADGDLPLHVAGEGGPALVVVPSIFGPAPDLLERLSPLAGSALVVVPDPFWRTGEGWVAYDDRELAFARLAEFDRGRAGREMAAAATWTRSRADGPVIGLGICFGGPWVNRMAVDGLLDGVVTWHGSRMEQFLDGVDGLRCPVHHHFGSADPVTPPEAIDAVRAALAGNDRARIVVHDGATHGFSHDGDAWDPAAFAAGYASVEALLHP